MFFELHHRGNTDGRVLSTGLLGVRPTITGTDSSVHVHRINIECMNAYCLFHFMIVVVVVVVGIEQFVLSVGMWEVRAISSSNCVVSSSSGNASQNE